MSRTLNIGLAAALAALVVPSLSVLAARTPTADAPAGATLWFANEYASAYYQIDNDTSEVVATILPGPAGGNVIEMRRKLKFDESQAITVGGENQGSVSATLIVKNTGKEILSRVRSAPLPEPAKTN